MFAAGRLFTYQRGVRRDARRNAPITLRVMCLFAV
jgi:hypothetical protein